MTTADASNMAMSTKPSANTSCLGKPSALAISNQKSSAELVAESITKVEDKGVPKDGEHRVEECTMQFLETRYPLGCHTELHLLDKLRS